MIRNVAPVALLLLAGSQAGAWAQTQTAPSAQSMTVQSLMADGHTVAGVVTSAAGGAGVFLQKANALVYCYATETPTSATVATQYCNPVK